MRSLFNKSYQIVLVALICFLCLGSAAWAEEPTEEQKKVAEKSTEEAAANVAKDASSDSKSSSSGGSDPKPESKYPPVSKVLKDTKQVDGLIKLHYSDTKLLAELSPGDLDKDHIVLITIAKGIGQRPLLAGFSWGFGDDWVWQFRKVGERIQIVRRNVRFKAKAGSPTAEAVKLAYTDSVLFSLPIATRGAGGSYIIDLTPVFFSDLPQIQQVLSGFTFSRARSTFLEPKGFKKNVEIQVAATYGSSGRSYIESVADSRAATINLHYSISRLPKNDYKPRLADDRVGYFLTAIKDFSKMNETDQFVRYINRWDLRKSDSKADISPPKKPIKFWLEKTIPYKYRKPIRDGIEEWNLAFEKAGFYDAIDVDQQPDDATWEPGDINYNTFRWITSNAGFAMGPSRVNPLTGEILDADIIFDASFLQYWKREYEVYTPQGIEVLTGGPIEIETYEAQQHMLPTMSRCGHGGRCACNLLGGVSQQLAFGSAMATARKQSPEQLEKLTMQALKEVTMHEVGHTLGLRHNFKGSTYRSLEELHDSDKTEGALSSSVMDYLPVNISPAGVEQGDYYSTTIGPYDYWAIEYGYKPLKDEKKDLAKIASRSGEPDLAYGTDEDTRGIDPDPHCRRYDMSDDLVTYAKEQAKLVEEALPNLIDDMVEEGEGYANARRAFGLLISKQAVSMFDASRYVGGLHVSRSHKGDDNAADPFEVVEAEKQRETLVLLGDHVFCDKPFNIPTELYNKLAPSKWSHWGAGTPSRTDYSVHETILIWQQRILDRLLASLTLRRVHDNEIKTEEEDIFTAAELFESLTDMIYSELDSLEEKEYSYAKPFVSVYRRNLQRAYLEHLIEIAWGDRYISYMDRGAVQVQPPPQDCQTVAFAELRDLKEQIDLILEDDPELDRYSSAHLQETSSRIKKALDAEMLNLPLRQEYQLNRLRNGHE